MDSEILHGRNETMVFPILNFIYVHMSINTKHVFLVPKLSMIGIVPDGGVSPCVIKGALCLL